MIKITMIIVFSFLVSHSLLIAGSLEEVTIYTEEYPPYNYRGKTGELQGVAVDLLVNAYKNANVRFAKNKIKLRPWPKAYREVLTSTNAMLFSMTRTESREKLFKWVGPISKTKVVLLAKKSNGIAINSIADISQYVIGGVHNDVGLSLVGDLVANKGQLRGFSSASAIAKVLNLGRIDLWAYEENVAKHFLRNLNLDLADFESVYTLSESELYYAFSLKTDQKIVDELQATLNKFRLISDN
ncbi:MAG: transporter substrate-binding domain-containing protein [Oceanospirillaceae bacterium]